MAGQSCRRPLPADHAGNQRMMMACNPCDTHGAKQKHYATAVVYGTHILRPAALTCALGKMHAIAWCTRTALHLVLSLHRNKRGSHVSWEYLCMDTPARLQAQNSTWKHGKCRHDAASLNRRTFHSRNTRAPTSTSAWNHPLPAIVDTIHATHIITVQGLALQQQDTRLSACCRCWQQPSLRNFLCWVPGL